MKGNERKFYNENEIYDGNNSCIVFQLHFPFLSVPLFLSVSTCHFRIFLFTHVYTCTYSPFLFPFDHIIFWLSCQKAIVVCVIRVQKKKFFKNQVNDECKVGHFADTCIKKKQNILVVCVSWLYLQESILLCFSQPLLHTHRRTSFTMWETNIKRETEGENQTKITWLTVCACVYACLHARSFFVVVVVVICFRFFFVKFSELIKIVVDCCLLLFCFAFIFIWISKSKWQNCIVRSSRLCVSCRDFHCCVITNHMHFILCTLNV